jgi:hypothetical protein
VIDEPDNLKLDRVPHPPYSSNLTLWNFWLFGIQKQKIKDRVFQMVEETMIAVHRVWDELTLEDLQSVFFNWIERFECVIEHEREYYTNYCLVHKYICQPVWSNWTKL